MYEPYWNLSHKPFDDAIEGGWYYPAESHQGALLKLRYAIENQRGASILSGRGGLGKTLIVNQLASSLPEQVSPRVHVVFPQMPADQLLAFITQELCGGPLTPPSNENIRRLREFLAENTAGGRHALLAIDEAHLIEDRQSIEMLRLLLNLQSAGHPQISLLLVGQPKLLATVERLTDFEDRIAVKCLLQAFGPTETAGYISHRMTHARAERMIFTDEAIDTVQQLSLGIPGRINRICDLALLIGFAEEKAEITAADVHAVAHELISVGEPLPQSP